jgi:hypothetical protein
MDTLRQHAYLRPAGGGPCLECGGEPREHEPFPRFISVQAREDEGAVLNLPRWQVPLWDGIHAWTAGFNAKSLKKHCEALAKRGAVPSQLDAVSLVEFVVGRALAVERRRIRRELEDAIEAASSVIQLSEGEEDRGEPVEMIEKEDMLGSPGPGSSQKRSAHERQGHTQRLDALLRRDAAAEPTTPGVQQLGCSRCLRTAETHVFGS